MATTTFLPKTDTKSNFITAENNGRIYDDGELLVVKDDTNDNKIIFKQGDGKTKFSELPDLYNQATMEDAIQSAKDAAKSESNALSYKESAESASSIATSAADKTNSYYGVTFSGSTSAGTRTGLNDGLTYETAQNVYPWAGCKRCCCTLNSDGTVTVNAFYGQPGYTEDGSNGEVLVRIPKFYVSGKIDESPKISTLPLPGFRLPKKFKNKEYCYYPAFRGSIGDDGKIHSIAGATPASNINIVDFMTKCKLWGDSYSCTLMADWEVVAYLMVVAFGTRNVQSIYKGVESLYKTNAATVSVATTSGNDVIIPTTSASSFEVGMCITVGTGEQNSSVFYKRKITAIATYDDFNTKLTVEGDAFTTAVGNYIWRMIWANGYADNSKNDGLHGFTFCGIENPLYGNQWEFIGDMKNVNGKWYYCDNISNFSSTSLTGYTELDYDMPQKDGWATAFGQDERFPEAQATTAASGGSDSTYLADYFWVNINGTFMLIVGSDSSVGSYDGLFCFDVNSSFSYAGWDVGGSLSIPG